ncbi:hypothetical protein ABH926_006893 [Catenulispora sp. GP43]|uniref:S53 family peptidase n=1 Tax=Catenulispora sp. GP43 TaxID=3156263 RepID=UPI003513A585
MSRKRHTVAAALAAIAVVLAAGLASTAPADAASGSTTATRTTPTKPKGPSDATTMAARSTAKAAAQNVCATPKPGAAACLAQRRTDLKPLARGAVAPFNTPWGYGYFPSDLQSAYRVGAGANGPQVTVAIVDAYDDPAIVADDAAYRAQFGLAACNATTLSGCVTKVNELGAPGPLPAPATGANAGWATEEALDVDMVSALCQQCHIMLVEANSAGYGDLGAGVNSAAAEGVKYISNSYGGAEFSGETALDTAYYNHPGVVVTASAGDSGYGVMYPAASPDVTAVGGTSLYSSGNARGWTENAWSGTGSGCSAYEAKPVWQSDTGCSRRTVADVSADADPNTGVAVYDSYNAGGWEQVGGTSESSPIIAAVYAQANTITAGGNPASYPYAHIGELNDVTSGSNGSCSPSYFCSAQTGYDGPTGNGTPVGTAGFVPDTVFSNPNLVLGARSTDGNMYASQGALSGVPWDLEISGVGHLAEASDSTNGPLLVTTSGNAEVYAKEGGLGAGWVDEGGPATQVAAASDPTNGPLLAYIGFGGELYAKEGSLSAGWVDEAGDVAQVAVASDPAHGPLLVIVQSNGNVWAKEGGLSTNWVGEAGDMTRVAAASDAANGPLITALSSTGEVWSKAGGLSTNWVDEAGGMTQIAVASDPLDGPLITAIRGDGEVLAKEGGLSTNWVDEHAQAATIAVGSDPGNGPLIFALTSGGAASVKAGALWTAWVPVGQNVLDITAAG